MLATGVLLALTSSPPSWAVPAESPAPGGPTTSLDDLRSTEREQAAELDDAKADLVASARTAGAALQAYSEGVHAMLTAQAEQRRQEAALVSAEADVQRQRAALARFAREAYAGDALAATPALATLLGGPTDDAAHAQRWLAIAGEQRARALVAMQEALTDRQRVAAAVDAATRRAEESAAALDLAKKDRDRALDEQRTVVARLEARLAATRGAVAEEQARRLAQARALAARHSVGGRAGNAISGEVGDCTGGQMELYANGEIPLDALCPLWGAPGHRLRADAAFAFNRLSTAYAEQFGQPICVTDSYRSYAEQVAVKKAKPDLAATPGTSNHGWGTATDLCGGVQEFGSPEHEWLLANAPTYSWFHPSWAEPGGSRPEPWHWEYGG